MRLNTRKKGKQAVRSGSLVKLKKNREVEVGALSISRRAPFEKAAVVCVGVIR